MNGYSPKLPLARDVNDGLYSMNKTAIESIKQDLKMLVLTNPGERIMNPEYGVGIKQVLFEQDTDDLRSFITDRINNQINTYMNFIQLDDLNIETDSKDENYINITIYYRVPYLTSIQELSLDIQK